MSLQGTVEFALQIKKFRNIDLFDSGFYNLRVAIYQQSNKKKVAARPFSIAEKPLIDAKFKHTKPHIRSCILSKSPTYITKTFAISLCEEEVLLNEFCCFKFDFNDIQKNENSSFIIEIDLMFADYTLYSEMRGSDENKICSFKKLCTYKASIRNPEEGIHEYIPVLFDYRHSCALEILLHTTTFNLRFKPESASMQPNQSGSEKEEQLILQSRLLKKMLNKQTSITLETLEDFYNQYSLPLKMSYRKLAEYYTYVLRIFIRESTHEEYSKFLNGGTSSIKNIKEQIAKEKAKEGKMIGENSKSSEEQKSLESNNEDSFGEFLEPLESRSTDTVILAIVQDMISMNKKVSSTWRFLNEMILAIPKEVSWIIQKDHNEKMKIIFNEKLSKKIYRTSDPVLSFEQNIGESHNQTAASKRGSKSFRKIGSMFSVQEMESSLNVDLQPITFEEICVKEQLRSQINNEAILSKIERNEQKNSYNGVHLIVLCHGFQGSSSDLRLLKNTILHLYPDTLQLCASANEDLTDGEIAGMGARLAVEVKNYIKEWVQDSNLGRLSFIGHSLGGVIIRAALPYLEDHSNKMHSFITFSSPHLGYMQNSSVFIDAGMWFLKQFKRSRCLKELTLTDADDIEETYIFKLSKMKGLGWFKNIMFLSSFQDQYAPFESTRIQMNKKTMPDENKQILYEQMATNILSEVTADCIYRIDVNFLIPEKNLDSMLGRAAHIQFLECKYLTRMLTCKYVDFFS